MAKNLERELPCLTSLLSGCKRKIHPKVMTGNGQLKRGAFIINDFLTPNVPLIHTSFTYRKLNMDEICGLKFYLLCVLRYITNPSMRKEGHF